METWPSGRRHFTANEANRKVSWVRISPLPPVTSFNISILQTPVCKLLIWLIFFFQRFPRSWRKYPFDGVLELLRRHSAQNLLTERVQNPNLNRTDCTRFYVMLPTSMSQKILLRMPEPRQSSQSSLAFQPFRCWFEMPLCFNQQTGLS